MQPPQLDTNSIIKTSNHCFISLEQFINFHAHMESFIWDNQKEIQISDKMNITPLFL